MHVLLALYYSRLRTKLDCEKREVECENEALRGKINDFRQKCTLLEEEAIVCKASMRQKDMDLAEIKDVRKRAETHNTHGSLQVLNCIENFSSGG